MIRVRRLLVLCVDDERPALALRKLVLEKNGYDVLTAMTSSEALRLFRDNPVAMVISDHLLGSESGVELAAAMKKISADVPIVMLAGAPPDTMGDIDCYICKGEPVESVLSTIHSLLCRGSRSSNRRSAAGD